jgi:hypothetical protein
MRQCRRTAGGDPYRQNTAISLGHRASERGETIGQRALARAVAERDLIDLHRPFDPSLAVREALRGPDTGVRFRDLEPHVAHFAPGPVGGFGAEHADFQAAHH